MVLGVLVVLAVTSVAAAVSASDFYLGDRHVVTLASDNFARHVEKSAKPVLVEFYSPGCPHCVHLKDVWRKVAANLAGHVVVGAVNCEGEALCSRFHIRGVPAIKFFPSGTAAAAAPLDYNGVRTVDGIVAFAKRHVPSAVTKVAEKARTGVVALDTFLAEQPSLGRVLLFKQGSMAPSLPYKTLSNEYRGRLRFGIADAKQGANLAERLGVELPEDSDALAIIPVGEQKGSLYKGKLTFTELSAFLHHFASESAANTSGYKRHKTDL